MADKQCYVGINAPFAYQNGPIHQQTQLEDWRKFLYLRGHNDLPCFKILAKFALNLQKGAVVPGSVLLSNAFIAIDQSNPISNWRSEDDDASGLFGHAKYKCRLI